jgi:tripartite-type tricarboxylate transporter receptor subunit TctC
MNLKKIITAGSLLTMAFAAAAQNFPEKPVQIILPYPPGGATDTLARNLAQRLTTLWSQQVLVDNKPGGNTVIGAQLVARAPADGYTLLLSAEATLVANPFLYAKQPYSPTKDFTPITVLTNVPQALVINPTVPATDLKQFIELVKKKPGAFSYGSFGTGSTGHLNMEKFKQATGTHIVHIPYKGLAPAITDLVGGNLQVMLGSIGSVSNFVKAGKLNALAISGKYRDPTIPNVPTFAEAGLPGFSASSWFFLAGPGGMPPAITEKIYKDVASVLHDPAFVRDSIARFGLEVVASTPQEFTGYIKTETVAWGKIIKETGATLE